MNLEGLEIREKTEGEQGLGFRFCFLCLRVEFLGFVHSPTGSLDMENDRMMHHSIDNRGGNDRISEVIAKVLPIDICRE